MSFRKALILLALLIVAAPVTLPAQEPEPATDAAFWRREDLRDILWSSRWAEQIFHTDRLSLRVTRGGPQEKLTYDPELHRIVSTWAVRDIDILPPRFFTAGEYASEMLEVRFGQLWPEEARKTLKGDPNLDIRGRNTPGGLVNLELPFELPGFAASIFGEGAPNLRVSGSERISMGGTSNWRVDDLQREGRRRSLFPTLEMRQELNVRLNGTIGDKLHIDIAQNSEASTSLENQIKIYYQGYEDDVVQRVDLGNTSMTLPRSTYVSVSTRQEGLFGVKMTGRLADWDFALIASKQEGQAEVASLTGGTQETRLGGTDGKIYDKDYEPRKYFFLSDPDSLPGIRVLATDLQVFVSTRDVASDLRQGKDVKTAYLSVTGDGQGARIKTDMVRWTQNEDYYFVTSDRTPYPILVLRNSLNDDSRLAVSYRITAESGAVVQNVGNYFTRAEGDTLQLKMIKPGLDDVKTDNVTVGDWAATRRLEMKNVYNLGARNIDPNALNIQVHLDSGNFPTDLNGVSYLEILGLDLVNNLTLAAREDSAQYGPQERGPDGKIDTRYIDLENGLLFMPDLRPFDPSRVDLLGAPGLRAPSRDRPRRKALGWKRLNGQDGFPYGVNWEKLPPAETAQEANADIYDRRDVRDLYRKYYIAGSFRAFQTEINLNKIDILENSETVRMDGEVLQRGIDYNINYDVGQIRLLSTKATNPNGNLQITYSYTPLFSTGNRSLVGFSTTYGGATDWDLSTTFLYETKGSPEYRPRLQQEPSRTMLADVSGSWRARPWLLTRLADALPLVSTNTPSNISFTGAMGLSMPNPNTKGNVYLDDMEGVVQTTSVGVGRETWQYSSPPIVNNQPLPAEERLGAIWYSVQRQVQRRDLAPKLQTIEANDYISALGIILMPNTRAIKPWLGLTQVLSQTVVDLSEAQYIEMWVNDFGRFHGANAAAGSGKKIHLDLGKVSEDAVWDPRTPPAPPDGRLNEEDLNHDAQRTLEEDAGLDTIPDVTELARGVPPDTSEYSVSTSKDPAGDDYDFSGNPDDYSGSIADRIHRFRHVNGTEGNQRLDSEDLNANLSLDTGSDYFSYTFPLDADSFTVVDVKRDYPDRIPLGSNNGWRLLRIPLNHPTASRVGSPDLNTVRHLRLWFEGFDDTTEFQVASIEIVGNRWERQPLRAADGTAIADSTQYRLGKVFNVAVVDNKENADVYTPPFKVRTIDRVQETERSLALRVENLEPGEQASAFKALTRDEDYTLYQTMSFYVQLRDGAPTDSLDFFLRFSSTANSDTTNAYELSRRLTDPNSWQTFDLELAAISRFKVGARDSLLASGTGVSAEGELPGGWHLKIYGRPSFSQLRRLQVGLRNVGDFSIARREVWFNELRLGEVRRDTGLAGRAAVSMALGDFATASAAVDQRGADFLTLGQTRGSGVATRSLTLTTAANLDKFLPGLNLQLPVTADFRSSRNVPKFRANNDIIFDGRDQADSPDITENSGRTFSVNARRISSPGTHWLIRNTLDALAIRASTSRSYSRQTTGVDSSQVATGSVAYTLRTASNIGLPLPAGWKLTPMPDQVALIWTGQYQEQVNYVRNSVDQTKLVKQRNTTSRASGLNFSTSFRPLPPVTWTVSSTRDLVKRNFRRFLVDDQNFRPSTKIGSIDIGWETARSERVTVTQSFNLIGFIRPRVSWAGEYKENHAPDLVSNADIDSAASISPDLKNIENSSSTQIGMTLPVAKIFQKLGARPGPKKPPVTAPAGAAGKEADRSVPPGNGPAPGGGKSAGDAAPPSTPLPAAPPVVPPASPPTTPPDTTNAAPPPVRKDAPGAAPPGTVDGSASAAAVPGAVAAPTDTTGTPAAPAPPPDPKREAAERKQRDEEQKERLEAERRQAEREQKLEAERAKKQADDAKKAAERAKKEEEELRRAEEKGRKEAAERARKDAERKKKDEREVENARRRSRRGGIGGGGGGGAVPPPAGTPPARPDSSGAAATPVSAPPPGAPPATTGAADDTTRPATPAGGPELSGGAAGAGEPGRPLTPSEKKARDDQEKQIREAEKKRLEDDRKRRKAEEEVAKKNQPPTPGPTLRELLFRELITVGDVRTNLTFTERNSVSKVHGSVPVPFRLGLSQDYGALPRAANSTSSHTTSQTATANANVTVLRDMAVDASFQLSDQQNDNNQAVSNTRTVTWPSLRINLNSIEKKFGLGGLFNSFTASSNFERREETSGTGSNKKERSTTTSAWRPFMQVDAGWKNGWRTTLSADRSTVVSQSNTGGTAVAGVVTTRTSSAYRIGLAKSLGLKGGGARAGVRNTIDVNLDVTYNRDVSISDYVDREDVAARSDNFQGRLSTSYRFTSTVSGSMQLTVGQRRDLEANTTDRSVGLQATAAVTF